MCPSASALPVVSTTTSHASSSCDQFVPILGNVALVTAVLCLDDVWGLRVYRSPFFTRTTLCNPHGAWWLSNDNIDFEDVLRHGLRASVLLISIPWKAAFVQRARMTQ